MREDLQSLKHLDGSRFCMVCMTVLDLDAERVQLAPIYGTARVLPDRLLVEEDSGRAHAVPDSALAQILPSDGTEMLKDAAYYVIVKIGEA